MGEKAQNFANQSPDSGVKPLRLALSKHEYCRAFIYGTYWLPLAQMSTWAVYMSFICAAAVVNALHEGASRVDSFANFVSAFACAFGTWMLMIYRGRMLAYPDSAYFRDYVLHVEKEGLVITHEGQRFTHEWSYYSHVVPSKKWIFVIARTRGFLILPRHNFESEAHYEAWIRELKKQLTSAATPT